MQVKAQVAMVMNLDTSTRRKAPRPSTRSTP